MFCSCRQLRGKVCIDTAPVYGFGRSEAAAEPRRMFCSCRQLRGRVCIDTAPVYGFGRSEEIVGKALEGSLRQKVTIATKVGLAWKDGAVYRDSRPARIREEVEDSLRRLRTDVIDLYQVHWPDFETRFAETARTLEDLRRQGKIRAIGVSNFSPTQMRMFSADAQLDAVQPPYNLFERKSRPTCCPTPPVHD